MTAPSRKAATLSQMVEGLRERRQSKASMEKASCGDLPTPTDTPSTSTAKSTSGSAGQTENDNNSDNDDNNDNNDDNDDNANNDNSDNEKASDQHGKQQLSPVQPKGGKDKKGNPPGYNKAKRDIVKLILVVVAASMLGGDPKAAAVFSVVAAICLKDGTLFSLKNLKWLGLCVLSFVMALSSWSLERAVSAQDNDTNPEINPMKNILWGSAKIIQLCWGMTLSVFLVSAYMNGHRSLLEFDYKWEPHAEPPPSGPRTKDPPPKQYLLY
jgi:hypothetical protein